MTSAAAPVTGGRKRLGVLLQLAFLALLFVPGFLYADDKYWLTLFNRFLALALFALSVDLVWGYTGLLSLGQGLYFGIGAYAVGYSLKLRQAAHAAGRPLTAGPDMALPDFMEYCRLEQVPGWVAPLIDLRLGLMLALVLPAVLATLFGLLVFSRRIKGVYFSLITQALVLAVFTLVVNQQPYTGGVVGMTRLDKLELFGRKFQGVGLYYLIAAVLALAYLLCLALVRSKFGKVLTAIRDNEYRVLALGYNTAMYKTFVLAFAAALAGLAGGLYVSALGTTGPDSFGIAFSIEVVIFVAVGGRGTLIGAVLGAILVNLANTILNNDKQLSWDLIRLCLFIGAAILAARWLYRPLKRFESSVRSKVFLAAGACLGGVIVGALLINVMNERVIRDTDESWPLILGGLFIGIVLFLPDGIVGGVHRGASAVRRTWEAWRKPREDDPALRPSSAPERAIAAPPPAPTAEPIATRPEGS